MEIEICKILSKYSTHKPSDFFKNIERTLKSDGTIDLTFKKIGSEDSNTIVSPVVETIKKDEII